MPKCSICSNPARPAIEADLAAKIPQVEVADKYGVSQSALSRHLHRHMDPPQSLAQVHDKAPDVLEQLTGTPQERMNKLIEIAAALLARAVRQSSVDTQIRGLGELRKVVELMEKVAGNMPPDTQVQVLQVIVPDGSDSTQSRTSRVLEG